MRSGCVIVPRVSRPWVRLETRCSTTWVVVVVGGFGVGLSGLRVSVEDEVEVVLGTVTQSEAVWKGACGMRPLGKGSPKSPATPVVMPRRKMSQWNPAGLRRGNSVPWAMSDDTSVTAN